MEKTFFFKCFLINKEPSSKIDDKKNEKSKNELIQSKAGGFKLLNSKMCALWSEALDILATQVSC